MTGNLPAVDGSRAEDWNPREIGVRVPGGLLEPDHLDALRGVQGVMGRTFGTPGAPLLVSIRSGASVSIPGMMDTVLNLGLSEQTVQGSARDEAGTILGDDVVSFALP